MRILSLSVKFALGLIVSSLFYASVSTAATLSTNAKEGIGTYLVDDKGMALYLFKKDQPGKSVCGAANDCIKKWPVFLADGVVLDKGIDPTNVGEITRDDGVKQTTYKGQPLYYFNKDKDDNDVYGQGVNNVWYVVAP